MIENISLGTIVGAGDAIGISDGSGAGSPHLHYTYRPGSVFAPATLRTTPIDPLSGQLRNVDRPPLRNGARSC